MNRKIQKSFIALILALCLIPSLGLLIFGPSKPAANEIAPAKPALLNEDGKFNSQCFSEMTEYIACSFALRRECISAWSWLNAKLFHSSVQEQVVLGKNGWLYYSETLDDYTGKGLTEDQLKAAVNNLALIQEYVKSCGADFIFTVAPNKNSLYPDNMPSYIKASRKNSNAVRMEKYLNAADVNYVDLFDVFDRQDEVLYYSTDTHWNAKGAALACDVLMGSLGRSSSFFEGPFRLNGIRKGDLYDMLVPEGKGTEAGISFDAALEYECDGNPKEGNAITIKTFGAGTGRLKCWRDSFGIELYPYLAQSFESSVFSRLTSYDMLDVQESFDTVIIEMCERNLPQLLTESAVFSAPERAAPLYSCSAESTQMKEENAKDPELKHVAALLPECAEFEKGVYLLCDGGCYEAAITMSEQGMGLSAFIPAEADVYGVIISVNGEYLLYPNL